MRILVIGAGAVGGYFGGRLTAAGRDVTFLVREGRAAQLQRTGLRIMSPHGDLTVQPKMLSAAALRESKTPFGLILLSTKAYQLASAMEDFAPAVGADTRILPLLNGMKHLDTLVARFGEAAVLGGSTRIVADLDAEGTVLHLEPLQDLVFGQRDRGRSAQLETIEQALHGAGFDDKPSPDVLAFMWLKWVFLSSLGAITCLLGGSIGEVAAAPGGPETVRAIAAEAAAIAAANGYPVPGPALAQLIARLTEPGSVLTASMYRDMTRGAPVEADHILGDLLARGNAHGVEAPLLRAAYTRLSMYSASRTR